jgi:hypothetical protein
LKTKTFNISSYNITSGFYYYRLLITKVRTTGSTSDTWTGVSELTINGA